MSNAASTLRVRRAGVRDVPLLALLNRQLIEDEGSRTRLSLEGLEKRMNGWLRNGYEAALFHLGETAVAYALSCRTGEGIFLRHLFVVRERRRNGIGRRAVQLLLEDVWPAGLRVTLDVLAHNQSGERFWRAVGFRDHLRTLELVRQPRARERLALIALGSNLGDARAILRGAAKRLDRMSALPLRSSSLWQTSPVDCPPGSPVFLNAAVALVPPQDETPPSLLRKLQALEKECGRRPKKVLNEPRPLDLDLITFGEEICATTRLALPHPRAHLRRFVLAPLNELAPRLVLPGQRLSVRELLHSLRTDEVVKRIERLSDG